MVALAVGLGAISSLAMTAPAMAASPNGVNCQAGTSQGDPNGGKISGRGSTFQAAAISTFTTEYESDVCGQPPLQYATDPAGHTMVAYNYPGAAATGSGAGQAAAGCRSDAFGGTDKPYTETLLHTDLNGAAGTGFTCPTVASPFTPGLPYPPAGSATAPAMVFPIAGGATAMGFNLGAVSCPAPATPPTALNFTSAEADAIWQGTINKWNDPTLVANNPGLSGCTGSIQRVARADNSGTTGQFMTYLNHIDSAQLCDTTITTWSNLAGRNPNNVWPTGCHDASNNVAPTVVEKAGTPALLNCVSGADTGTGCGDGSIGYGELGIWATTAPSVPLASLQTAASNTGTPVYITPGSGLTGSNCSFLALGGLPGSKTANDSVSLNGTPKGSGFANWASDATTNKSDFTFQGSNYPICGLTWDIVYTNLHLIGVTGDPVPGLTANQRMNLYSFFSYALTTEGQAGLSGAGYDALPASWDSTIRGGFQNNF
jgi:ABC-type phosphate transport system substrate-binding protein